MIGDLAHFRVGKDIGATAFLADASQLSCSLMPQKYSAIKWNADTVLPLSTRVHDHVIRKSFGLHHPSDAVCARR